MADASVSVTITAQSAGFVAGVDQAKTSTNELATRLAMAQAEMRAASRETRTLADTMLRSGGGSTAMGEALSMSATRMVNARNEMRSLNAELHIGRPSGQLVGGIENLRNTLLSATAPIAGFIGGIHGIAAAVASGLAVERIVAFVESMAELGERMLNFREILGTSVEGMGEFFSILKAENIHAETAGRSIERLQRAMSEAAANPGSATGTAFHALGISLADVVTRQKDAVAMMELVKQKFQEAEPGANRTAAMMALMGRNFDQLIPYLRKSSQEVDELRSRLIALGATADETGKLSVISTEMAQRMDETRDRMDLLGVAMQSLGVTIFGTIKPAVDAVSTTLFELISTINRSAESGGAFHTVLQGLNYILRAIAAVVTTVVIGFRVFEDQMRLIIVPIHALGEAIGTFLRNVATLNFDRIGSDLSEGIGKGAKDFQDALNDMKRAGEEFARDIKIILGEGTKFEEDTSPKRKVEAISRSGGGGAGGENRVQQWREELQQMLQAERNFFSESTADELDFWRRKRAENQAGWDDLAAKRRAYVKMFNEARALGGEEALPEHEVPFAADIGEPGDIGAKEKRAEQESRDVNSRLFELERNLTRQQLEHKIQAIEAEKTARLTWIATEIAAAQNNHDKIAALELQRAEIVKKAVADEQSARAAARAGMTPDERAADEAKAAAALGDAEKQRIEAGTKASEARFRSASEDVRTAQSISRTLVNINRSEHDARVSSHQESVSQALEAEQKFTIEQAREVTDRIRTEELANAETTDQRKKALQDLATAEADYAATIIDQQARITAAIERENDRQVEVFKEGFEEIGSAAKSAFDSIIDGSAQTGDRIVQTQRVAANGVVYFTNETQKTSAVASAGLKLLDASGKAVSDTFLKMGTQAAGKWLGDVTGHPFTEGETPSISGVLSKVVGGWFGLGTKETSQDALKSAAEMQKEAATDLKEAAKLLVTQGVKGAELSAAASGKLGSANLGTTEAGVAAAGSATLPTTAGTAQVGSAALGSSPGTTSGTGKASWFGPWPGHPEWADSMNEGKPNASGAPMTQPGVAFYDRSTLGKWFVVSGPDGKQFVLPQVDIGPAPWTGKSIDINAPAAAQMGYTPNTFPTGGQFSWRPATADEIASARGPAAVAGAPSPAIASQAAATGLAPQVPAGEAAPVNLTQVAGSTLSAPAATQGGGLPVSPLAPETAAAKDIAKNEPMLMPAASTAVEPALPSPLPESATAQSDADQVRAAADQNTAAADQKLAAQEQKAAAEKLAATTAAPPAIPETVAPGLPAATAAGAAPIPEFLEGGRVGVGGLALVHAGETVVPEGAGVATSAGSLGIPDAGAFSAPDAGSGVKEAVQTLSTSLDTSQAATAETGQRVQDNTSSVQEQTSALRTEGDANRQAAAAVIDNTTTIKGLTDKIPTAAPATGGALGTAPALKSGGEISEIGAARETATGLSTAGYSIGSLIGGPIGTITADVSKLVGAVNTVTSGFSRASDGVSRLSGDATTASSALQAVAPAQAAVATATQGAAIAQVTDTAATQISTTATIADSAATQTAAASALTAGAEFQAAGVAAAAGAATSAVGSTTGAVGSVAKGASGLLGLGSFLGFLAEGSEAIPDDGFAGLHKGEMVVPQASAEHLREVIAKGDGPDFAAALEKLGTFGASVFAQDGIWSVSDDGTQHTLHAGEMVVPASEAVALRSSASKFRDVVQPLGWSVGTGSVGSASTSTFVTPATPPAVTTPIEHKTSTAGSDSLGTIAAGGAALLGGAPLLGKIFGGSDAPSSFLIPGTDKALAGGISLGTADFGTTAATGAAAAPGVGTSGVLAEGTTAAATGSSALATLGWAGLGAGLGAGIGGLIGGKTGAAIGGGLGALAALALVLLLDEGKWKISEDGTQAILHRDEMVIPAAVADPLRAVAGGFNDLTQRFVGSYAVGAVEVPETGLAEIHEGEMIVPARAAAELRSGDTANPGSSFAKFLGLSGAAPIVPSSAIASTSPPGSEGLGRILSAGMMGAVGGGRGFEDLLERRLPHFAVGAWDISRDMAGYLHRGEAVMPTGVAEQMRSGKMFGGNRSNEVNLTYSPTVNAPEHMGLSQLLARDSSSMMGFINSRIRDGALDLPGGWMER